MKRSLAGMDAQLQMNTERKNVPTGTYLVMGEVHAGGEVRVQARRMSGEGIRARNAVLAQNTRQILETEETKSEATNKKTKGGVKP